MIQVKVAKDHIKVSGHAGYEKWGKDIVCASVSSIVITTVNAIVRLDKNSITYQEHEGLVEIKVLQHNPITDTLLLNMIELLKELELMYSENIKVWQGGA